MSRETKRQGGRGSLQAYRAKRDFDQTREPAGRSGRAGGRRQGTGGKFVVQKHAASHLHYDFRLEMKGVLKSWAVPKGFPMKKGERRLAVEVEDHPVEYGRFEGTIPEGNYGAGTVQLWDCGSYEIKGEGAFEGWKKGKMSLVLQGEKLKGCWTLVRTRGEDGRNAWLLIKAEESLRRLSVKEQETSVASGKTLAEISRGRRTWTSSGRSGGDKTESFKVRVAKKAKLKE